MKIDLISIGEIRREGKTITVKDINVVVKLGLIDELMKALLGEKYVRDQIIKALRRPVEEYVRKTLGIQEGDIQIDWIIQFKEAEEK